MNLSGPDLLAQANAAPAYPVLLVVLGTVAILLLIAMIFMADTLTISKLKAKLRNLETAQASLRAELEQAHVANATLQQEAETARAETDSLQVHLTTLQNTLDQIPDPAELESQLRHERLANHVLKRCQMRLETQARSQESTHHGELQGVKSQLQRVTVRMSDQAETAKRHRSQNVQLRRQLKQANRKVRSLNATSIEKRNADQRNHGPTSGQAGSENPNRNQPQTTTRRLIPSPNQIKLQLAQRKLKSLRRLLSQ